MFAFVHRRTAAAAFVVSCIAITGVAITGAVAGPAEVAQIKPRQDKLRDMGGALKAIADDIKRGRIDWDNTVIPNAQTIKARKAM
jgi:hypothetical protein